MRHLPFLLTLLLTTGCVDTEARLNAKRNQQVRANLNTLRTGLLQYCADHKHFPTADQFRQDFLQHNYLPGNRLADNPWNKSGTAMQVVATSAPNDTELWKSLSQPPGTLIYLYMPPSKTYLVYGVGEDWGKPKLLACTTGEEAFLFGDN